jgi:hypothetical protein
MKKVGWTSICCTFGSGGASYLGWIEPAAQGAMLAATIIFGIIAITNAIEDCS